jgi:hypothetical protein
MVKGKYIRSKETIEKLRKSHTGKKLSNEIRNKISIAHKGKIVKESTKQKLSQIHKGKHYNPKNNLRKTFENLCKVNDLIIEDKNRKGGLLPTCFIIRDDGKGGNKIEIIGFPFQSYQEKIIMKNYLMKMILSKDMEGYILFLDVKMTIMDKNNNVVKVHDAVMRSLCSPKLRIKEIVIYDEEKRKIIQKTKALDTDDKKEPKYTNHVDEWDLYAQHFEEDDKEWDKKNEKYQQYKKDNPDKYKGID